MESNDIAGLVHAKYASLPKTGKPQASEWTVLAGIVMTRAGAEPQVVALGTGTKCLTATQIAADRLGECVHDAHAEVCARRAFLHFLLEEMQACSRTNNVSAVLQRSSGGGFELRPSVQLHLYSSDPPCGDAAIFVADSRALRTEGVSPEPPSHCDTSGLPMSAVPAKRPRPHDQTMEDEIGSEMASLQQRRTGAKPAGAMAMAAEAATGGHTCQLGILRTKPGRGERTCCMSCSDKLARWLALGVQGALLSLLLPRPVRFASIVIGQPCCEAAMRRAVERGLSLCMSPPHTPVAVRIASSSLQW